MKHFSVLSVLLGYLQTLSYVDALKCYDCETTEDDNCNSGSKDCHNGEICRKIEAYVQNRLVAK